MSSRLPHQDLFPCSLNRISHFVHVFFHNELPSTFRRKLIIFGPFSLRSPLTLGIDLLTFVFVFVSPHTRSGRFLLSSTSSNCTYRPGHFDMDCFPFYRYIGAVLAPQYIQRVSRIWQLARVFCILSTETDLSIPASESNRRYFWSCIADVLRKNTTCSVSHSRGKISTVLESIIHTMASDIRAAKNCLTNSTGTFPLSSISFI